MSAPRVAFPLRESVHLTYPLTQRMLADHGIRALFVKGPVAAAQGLRADRTSSDVDILVAPDQVAQALRMFERHGWARYHGEETDALAIGTHAQTYQREGWPCTVDLHAHFPGFLAPAATVFDHLWARHTEVALAHQPIAAPHRHDHLALLTLHALRGLALDAGLPLDVRAAWQALPDKDLHDALDSARATGALEPLRATLSELGIDAGPPQHEHARALRHWQALRENPGDSGALWAVRWDQAPWSQRPALVWRAFWDISMDNTRTPQEWAQASPRERARGRAIRAGKGLSAAARQARRRVTR